MWSSTSEEHRNLTITTTTTTRRGGRTLTGVSSSSSASSSPSPSPSPFSPSSTLPHPRPKTMEEVWKDINLSSLSRDVIDINRPGSTMGTTNNINFEGMIFQDFLARPAIDPPPERTVTAAYGSPPLPPPATVLSLNSVPDFQLFGNPNSFAPPRIPNASSFGLPFDQALPSPPRIQGNKRFPESEDAGGGGDRRNKRMIKNRESAARSRARKQAYTTELELEVAHLMEENARLKKQQQQLCLAAAAQLPKKHTLHRTSTAPF